jgi:hypothetical protein
MKAGLTKMFHRVWSGPFQVTKKISELNYEIMCQNGKKFFIRTNRIKRAYDQNLWRPNPKQRAAKKPEKRDNDTPGSR